MVEPNAPTPERAQRSAFLVGPAVATESGPAKAGSRVYRALSAVERMARDGALEPRQAQAAERLCDDYELGIAGARQPANGSLSSTGWFYSEARLAAVHRYQTALAKLGPRMATYVVPIALGVPPSVSLSSLARHLGQNRQEVAGILKLGLTTLADHYRIDG